MSVITDMLRKLREKHNISIAVYPFFYKGGEIKYAACVMYDSDIYVISITDDVVVIEKYHRGNMNGQHLHYSHIDNVEDVVHIGDVIRVRVKEIDDQGRVNLTHKPFSKLNPEN